MNEQDTLTDYLSTFIEELVQNGMKHVVISPGSRSTPLALLLAAYPEVKIHMNMDERSAAYYALGIAKTMQEPVGVVCTSGTAAVNFHPAVVEAYYSRVPLIVLTADRPHELRDTGAPQTIDQIHLYGKHVKWFMDISLPDTGSLMIQYAKKMGARAVASAMQQPKGPVHLNIPLREPLVPDLERAKSMFQKQQKPSRYQTLNGSLTLPPEQWRNVAQLLFEAERGVIICGELPENGPQQSIIRLSEKLGFPILADPLSQLRSGDYEKSTVIDTYDTFLRNEQVSERLSPDLIIRFGPMPVSKALLLFLKKQLQAEHVIVDGGGGWRDLATHPVEMIYSDEQSFCDMLIKEVKIKKEYSWMNEWRKVNDHTKKALLSVKTEEELSEGKLFSLLADFMPDYATLFVGSSMPIRDADTFFHANPKRISIFSNRGANGIDGVVSSAVGTSTVRENTVLVIGDLSFYHDMNGLLAAKLLNTNITILLINNDGGGIFSFLPQADEKQYFEKLFGTPHGLDFSHVAAMYGATYRKVTSWEECEEAFQQSFEQQGIKIIELPTERSSNVKKHRLLWEHTASALSEMIREETE